MTPEELKTADEVAQYWRNVAYKLREAIVSHKFLKEYHGQTTAIDRGLWGICEETV